jgi:iron only hydrogenase large subunit-like protein
MSHHQPDLNKNVNLTIDGIPVTVPEGTRILEAAKKIDINIPTLCEHPDLCERALCRICVVECDGRGKLAAACANDVWEGVSVVTSNKRLFNIRKTIIELILANHPQDCLSCICNKNCELQSLAFKYGIFAASFGNDSKKPLPKIESDTIVRDISKCIKCGRCVEECQEVQTIRAINTSHRGGKYEVCTAYKQSLKDVNCVFCGQCAAVCPVGAIYGYSQAAEVQALLSGGVKSIAQISPAFASALSAALASGIAGDAYSAVSPLETDGITSGKITAAVKLLGFDKVYDAGIAANMVNSEISGEVKARKTAGAKLPLISGCSQGVARFVKNFYPGLEDHLFEKNPGRSFAGSFKDCFAKETGTDASNIMTVSFVPCIAQKYSIERNKTDFILTAGELAEMIKMAGIMIKSLPEELFDSFSGDLPKPESPLKKETVHGFAQARKVMESIRKGACDADWIEILSCPGGCVLLM